MWFFVAGFISGMYVNQEYNIPSVLSLLDRLKEEEKKRRKT